MPFKDPEARKAYDRARNKTAKRKASFKAYNQTAERKAKLKVHRRKHYQSPAGRAYYKAREQTAERKAYHKAIGVARRKPNGHEAQKHLYIMSIAEVPDLYKIGRTADIAKRRKSLNQGWCLNLRIVGEYENYGHLELPIHDLLAPYRKESPDSREWFSASLEYIHETIKLVISRQPPTPGTSQHAD